MTPPSRSPRPRGRWLAGLIAAPVAATLLATAAPAVPSVALAPADVAAAAVLPAAESSAPLPDPGILSAKLRRISTAGIGKVGIVVTTPDGVELVDRNADRALTPASTMKVLTAMAALDLLGPERTFATTTVHTGGGRVVLVGGGDPLLTDSTSSSPYKLASLQQLARDTVTALRTAGRTSVRLRYDATLFSGPTFSPYWKSRWLGWEARVDSLEINSGKVSGGRASANPGRTAAIAFAKRLERAGIGVTSILAGTTGGTGTELARVTSSPVSRIIRRTLLLSDNVAAETLLRHAAIAAGREGSFSGAAANLEAWLRARGLWASGARILDGSGLAPGSRLTPAQLAAALRLALADPAFAPVVDGLPVAGRSGTLEHRFDDPSERSGRGRVRAKTGTLSGLAGLAGYVTTRDGAQLVFAELGDDASSYYRVYDWLDREAALIARCGCR